MPSPPDRKKILQKIRQAIREHQFTPRDLSIPAEADVIMVLLSVDDFPYKMAYTKLAIICFIGSRGSATRAELLRILRKDYTTIAHNLIDLEKYGYITHTITPTGKRNARTHTYRLTKPGTTIFSDFCHYYQQKIIETISTFQNLTPCDPATPQTPPTTI